MENKSIRVGQYLVSKGGKKYLKFENRRNKDGSPNGSMFPLVINEGDILFLDLYDDEFRETYNVPDFVRGSVTKPASEVEQTAILPKGARPVGKPATKPTVTTSVGVEEDEF